MGCLLVVISAAMPRFGFFLFWLLRPARVEAAFDTFIIPLLGIIFFPLATLLYAVLYTAGGLTGWVWFWVVVAGFFDLVNTAASAARRNEVTDYRFS
jgi:hypothetical protein